MGNKNFDGDKKDTDSYVKIDNGNIGQGIVDKKIYQERSKGLVHSVFNDYGYDEARHLLDNTQRLININKS